MLPQGHPRFFAKSEIFALQRTAAATIQPPTHW